MPKTMPIPPRVPYAAFTDRPLSEFVSPDDHKFFRLWNDVERRYEEVEVWWRDNVPFEAALVLDTITARGDLANVRLKTTDSKVFYRIRAEMFVKMLPRVNIVSGVIVGMWMFERRGNTAYLIPEFLKEEAA